MKKIFTFIVAVLLLFVSCIQTEDLSMNPNVDEQEIIFNVDNALAPVTKAITSGTSLVDNFGIYGYVTGAGVDAAGYIMKNAEYEETGDAANSAHYYWPKSDNPENVNVLFTGYSQYVSSPTFDNNTGVLTLTVPTLTQALINTPANFNDILYTQVNNVHHQDAELAHARVPLHFNHALSWIEFQAKVDNNATITEVEITDITFDGGLYTTGNLELNTKSFMEAPNGPAVSGQATKDATLNFATSTAKTLTGGGLNKSSYSVISDALIVPQAVPTSVTIKFNIKIQNTAGDEIYYVGRTITRTINSGNDVTDPTPVAYAPNYLASTKYIYKIKINVDGIDFTVDVINWSTSQFQIWDHDQTAYVEHFFDKASTQMVPSLAIA